MNKSWKTLISDPPFIKIHLNRSSQNQSSLNPWVGFGEDWFCEID
jgi:hypothetical protein